MTNGPDNREASHLFLSAETYTKLGDEFWNPTSFSFKFDPSLAASDVVDHLTPGRPLPFTDGSASPVWWGLRLTCSAPPAAWWQVGLLSGVLGSDPPKPLYRNPSICQPTWSQAIDVLMIAADSSLISREPLSFQLLELRVAPSRHLPSHS